MQRLPTTTAFPGDFPSSLAESPREHQQHFTQSGPARDLVPGISGGPATFKSDRLRSQSVDLRIVRRNGQALPPGSQKHKPKRRLPKQHWSARDNGNTDQWPTAPSPVVAGGNMMRAPKGKQLASGSPSVVPKGGLWQASMGRGLVTEKACQTQEEVFSLLHCGQVPASLRQISCVTPSRSRTDPSRGRTVGDSDAEHGQPRLETALSWLGTAEAESAQNQSGEVMTHLQQLDHACGLHFARWAAQRGRLLCALLVQPDAVPIDPAATVLLQRRVAADLASTATEAEAAAVVGLRVQQLTDAEHAAVLMLRCVAGKQVLQRIWCSVADQVGMLSSRRGIAGRAALDGEMIQCSEPADDSRFDAEIDSFEGTLLPLLLVCDCGRVRCEGLSVAGSAPVESQHGAADGSR